VAEISAIHASIHFISSDKARTVLNIEQNKLGLGLKRLKASTGEET